MPDVHPLKHEGTPIVRLGESVAKMETRSNIRSRDAKYPVWGWKNPSDLYCFDQFSAWLRNPQVVVVVRHQLDICESIAKHERVEFTAVIEDVARTYADLMSFVARTVFPVHIVTYEQLSEYPREFIAELVSRLGLICTAEQMDAAERIVSSPKYVAVDSDDHDGKFSEEELLQDRWNAQARHHGSEIKILSDAALALNSDRLLAEDQMHELDKLIIDVLETRFPESIAGLDEDQLDQLLNLPIERLLSVVAELSGAKDRVAGPPREVASHAGGDGRIQGRWRTPVVKISAESYRRAREQYLSAAMARLEVQRQLDDLDDKYRELTRLAGGES